MFAVRRAATVARVRADQDYPFPLSILFGIIRLVAPSRPSQSRAINSIRADRALRSQLSDLSLWIHLRLQLHRPRWASGSSCPATVCVSAGTCPEGRRALTYSRGYRKNTCVHGNGREIREILSTKLYQIMLTSDFRGTMQNCCKLPPLFIIPVYIVTLFISRIILFIYSYFWVTFMK